MIKKSIFFIVAIICINTVVSDSFGKPSLRPVDECFDDDGRSIACDDFPSPLTEYYRIYYRCNGAYPLDGLISSNDLTYGDSYTLQSTSVCSKGGYNVSSSWTCSPSISQPSGTWNKYTNVTCDVTYTPKTYTLIYKCGEGTGSDETNNMTYDTTNYSLKSGAGNCSKTNSTFDGWTCKNSSGSEVSLSTSTTKWNIASNVTCTANWIRNTTINLEWYNGDELFVKNTCTIGDTIGSLPTPTKPGYVFKGWKNTCGIQKLLTTTNGTKKGYYEYGGGNSNLSTYGITEKGNWATEFSYGTIYGEASSNTTGYTTYPWSNNKYTEYPGNIKPKDEINKNQGNPSTSEINCWCRITGFTPSGTSYTNGATCKVTSAHWVFQHNDHGSDSCASFCATNVYTYQSVREVMFKLMWLK